MKKLLFGIAILAIAVMSHAQRGMRGFAQPGSPLGSIVREDVQKELALTDEQTDKIKEITDPQKAFPKMQAAMQEAGLSFEDFRTEEGQKKMRPIMEKMQASTKKEIEAVLTPAQIKRWGEVSIQLGGNLSAMQPEVAKALGVTEDQDKKFKDLQKQQQEAMRGLGEKMRNQELTMEDFQERMKKNTEIMNTEVGKILTEAQRAKLKEMGGKPFEKKDDN